MQIRYVRQAVYAQGRAPVPYHAHDCYELIYYYKANGIIHYKTPDAGETDERDTVSSAISTLFLNFDSSQCRSFPFQSNHCVLFRPGTIHNEIHRLDGETHTVFIGFTLDSSDGLDPDDCSVSDQNLELLAGFEKVIEEYREQNRFADKMMESYVRQILIRMLRLSQQTGAETRDPMHYVYAYIGQYYMTDINLESLAHEAGYSTDHFRRLFKQRFGVLPKELILDKRLQYAQNLLTNTDMPLESIAENCGFGDYNQFAVFFRQRTALSPKAYRNSTARKN